MIASANYNNKHPLRGTFSYNYLVSRSQTQTDGQGLIACSISACTVRVWATDTAKFVLATTQNCEVVDWLKGLRHLWMFRNLQDFKRACITGFSKMAAVSCCTCKQALHSVYTAKKRNRIHHHSALDVWMSLIQVGFSAAIMRLRNMRT